MLGSGHFPTHPHFFQIEPPRDPIDRTTQVGRHPLAYFGAAPQTAIIRGLVQCSAQQVQSAFVQEGFGAIVRPPITQALSPLCIVAVLEFVDPLAAHARIAGNTFDALLALGQLPQDPPVGLFHWVRTVAVMGLELTGCMMSNKFDGHPKLTASSLPHCTV